MILKNEATVVCRAKVIVTGDRQFLACIEVLSYLLLSSSVPPKMVRGVQNYYKI